MSADVQGSAHCHMMMSSRDVRLYYILYNPKIDNKFRGVGRIMIWY